jgi:hypothetical protein
LYCDFNLWIYWAKRQRKSPTFRQFSKDGQFFKFTVNLHFFLLYCIRLPFYVFLGILCVPRLAVCSSTNIFPFTIIFCIDTVQHNQCICSIRLIMHTVSCRQSKNAGRNEGNCSKIFQTVLCVCWCYVLGA